MTDPHEQSQIGTTENPLVGKIVKVPDEICGTGFIKIVGVNTNNNTQLHMTWDYKARCYDPLLPHKYYSWFDVTKEELDSWLAEMHK